MFELLRILLKLIASKRVQQILVVFQNNHELRGGGGFITQLLDISTGRGKFKMNFRHDYHDLRGDVFIEPPVDVKRYLGLKHWYLRDANLFGDFKKNAENVSNNYRTIYKHHEVAAVIAVNFSLLEKILQILVNLKLRDKNLTSKNLFSELTGAVSDVDHHDLYALNSRKYVLKELFSKLTQKMIQSFWKWPTFLKLFQESVKTKDLQIYFFDEELQQKLLKKALAETFTANGATDFLAIVENNFLGLKTNRYLRRMVFHDVQFFFDPKHKALSDAIVTVKIRTEHFGSFNYPLSGTYQSVTTIFFSKIARNCKVLTAEIKFDTNESGDFQSLTYHKTLSVREDHEITIQYCLPAKLFCDASYSFRYIKQSGVQHEHIFETISYPDQYEFELNNDLGSVAESKLFLDHTNVDRSYSYAVHGKFHLQNPRIFSHEIISPSIIQIRFNEPVNFKNSLSTNQIKVINSQTGTEVNIEKVEFANDNRYLLIHVPKLPKDEERFYQVHLSNIQNQAGVSLNQEPKRVTVVYRSKFFK